MPRFVLAVCTDLVHLIPDETEPRFTTLKYNINKHIIDSIPFTDPNLVKSSHFWNKLSYYLNNSITVDDYNNIPWCKEFIDIFQNPDYKINDPNYHFE